MSLANEYQDEYREEILNGKKVLMSPRPRINHIRAGRAILRIFDRYFRGNPCEVFYEPDVQLTKKDLIVPDIAIVCNKDIIEDNIINGPPDLIAEILSPATSRRDRGYKKRLYEKCGIKEYWIVDVDSRIIEVHLLTSGKYLTVDYYELLPDWELEDMTEQERAAYIYEFKTHLFEDLIIDIREVFEDIE